MKKRLPALACALALALCGCSSMLNREYFSSSDHVEYSVSESASVLQAENYQGLVNAILYFVTEHEETGLIHLSNYAGAMAADLDRACGEVCTEDPLGAYAVEEITHTYANMTSYYEVQISISYARTPEEVGAIVPAAGSTAIRQTISAAMAAFSDKCVLRMSYFTGDADSLRQLAYQTWLDTPLAALVRPKITVELYPKSGTSRIVEVGLEWPGNTAELVEQRAALEQEALALLERMDTPPEELTLEELLKSLRRAAICDAAGGDTAYSVLGEGRGNDRGMALALRLLCQLADLEATVAEGQLNGAPRFWIIAPTSEGYRHLDPTAAEPVWATDDVFREAGYSWDESRYPACTDYAAAAQPEPGAEDGGEDGGGEPDAEDGSEAPEQTRN